MLADDTTIHKPVKTEVHDTNDASEATTTSLSAHLSFGNQQITEVSDHKVLGVTKDNYLTRGPHIRDLCKTTAKKSTNQQKLIIFLTVMPEKRFSKHTFSQV